FEAILDFVGERKYASTMIQCEVVTHEGYDVPPDVFRIFFATVAATLKALLAKDWTAEMDQAWTKLLISMKPVWRRPDSAPSRFRLGRLWGKGVETMKRPVGRPNHEC
ncbi:MAG: hypothetical protein RLZZ141_780, partial [Pseudomonadota bacterium]